MTAEGEFPKADGDILYASEVNNLKNPIKQIETTGLDINASSPTTASLELDALPATDSAYAVVEVVITSEVTNSTTNINFQIKEIGESYSTKYNVKTISAGSSGDDTASNTTTQKFYMTLTAGMKTNGYQVKINTSGSGASYHITTKQVILYEIGY